MDMTFLRGVDHRFCTLMEISLWVFKHTIRSTSSSEHQTGHAYTQNISTFAFCTKHLPIGKWGVWSQFVTLISGWTDTLWRRDTGLFLDLGDKHSTRTGKLKLGMCQRDQPSRKVSWKAIVGPMKLLFSGCMPADGFPMNTPDFLRIYHLFRVSPRVFVTRTAPVAQIWDDLGTHQFTDGPTTVKYLGLKPQSLGA